MLLLVQLLLLQGCEVVEVGLAAEVGGRRRGRGRDVVGEGVLGGLQFQSFPPLLPKGGWRESREEWQEIMQEALGRSNGGGPGQEGILRGVLKFKNIFFLW